MSLWSHPDHPSSPFRFFFSLFCLQANTFTHIMHPKRRCTSKINMSTRLFMFKSRRTLVFRSSSAGGDLSPPVSQTHKYVAQATSVSAPFDAFSSRKQGHVRSPGGFGAHIVVFCTTSALSFMKDFSFVAHVTIHVPAPPAIPHRRNIKSLNAALCSVAKERRMS